MKHTHKVLVLVLFMMLALPFAWAEEETTPDPNLPGNPDCATCKGTGKVGYGKKAGDLALITYCQFKDAGKTCPVKIGGWEPCAACEDFPGMQAIFDEHDRIRKAYREEGAMYTNVIAQSKAPLPKFSFVLGKHCRVFMDYPHSKWHTLVIYTEKCWIKFAEQFEMGGEESDWGKSWANGKANFFCVSSMENFQQYCEWAYTNKIFPYETIQIGLQTVKNLGAVGLYVPVQGGNAYIGRFTHQSEVDMVDERGLVDSLAESMLNRGFMSVKDRDPFPHWVSQGLSTYYQQSVTGGISWYQVAYGMGNRRDQETWGRFDGWLKLLGEASSVPKGSFDDKTNSWKGLIPMETLINMKVTTMPFQGLAQSWAMVSYMMADGERSKTKAQEKRMLFKEFLKAIGGGMNQVEAIQKVYGVKDLAGFEGRFRAWLPGFCK
ncbi:MAG: hypothetical protein WC712_02400 [Candidatus Brocadiia bacterium]